MERALKTLFDFQKFEGNSDLQQIIDSTHSRYPVRELDLDDMEWVSAAGTPDPLKKKGNQDADPHS